MEKSIVKLQIELDIQKAWKEQAETKKWKADFKARGFELQRRAWQGTLRIESLWRTSWRKRSWNWRESSRAWIPRIMKSWSSRNTRAIPPLYLIPPMCTFRVTGMQGDNLVLSWYASHHLEIEAWMPPKPTGASYASPYIALRKNRPGKNCWSDKQGQHLRVRDSGPRPGVRFLYLFVSWIRIEFLLFNFVMAL